MKSLLVWKKTLAALLVLLMIPATSGISSTQTVARPQPTYDGESIVRGLFLADGPVAKLFPEIWESPELTPYMQHAAQETSAEELAAGRQKVIALLHAQDSTFFTRFGTEMQSGDRVRVDAALAEITSRFQKLLDSSISSDGRYMGTDKCLWGVNAVALINALAVWNVAAVVVAIAIALYKIRFLPPAGINSAGSQLRHDELVDLIAQRLGPESGK